MENHCRAAGSWADKERTVIAGRQCRLEQRHAAPRRWAPLLSPSLASPFSCSFSLSVSLVVLLASKPINYLHLHFLPHGNGTFFSNRCCRVVHGVLRFSNFRKSFLIYPRQHLSAGWSYGAPMKRRVDRNNALSIHGRQVLSLGRVCGDNLLLELNL